MKLILKIVGGLVILGVIALIGIQFVPVERTNPPVVSEPKWDSPETKALAERACFDCHSNQTKWPWYSQVAPASWLVADHVQEGRAKLNFSEWGKPQGGEGVSEAEQGEDEEREGREGGERGEGAEPDEIAETVEKGDMPMPSYLLLHPEARLTPAETQALIAGLKATFGSGAEGAMAK
ncbi:MAG: heme-binding domain-containing protein [Anaerolineae bacterium]